MFTGKELRAVRNEFDLQSVTWLAVSGNAPIMTAIPVATPGDGTELQWRVYPPHFVYSATAVSPTPTPASTPTPGPCVIVQHGGSFIGGSPFQGNIEHVAQLLSAEGFWVFVPDYRLAPCNRIWPNQPGHSDSASGRPPEQTDDVMSAVIAVRNSPHCNGKVGILAVSTGGCIASYVSLFRGTINVTGRPQWTGGGDDGSTPDLRPDCVVTFSSPFDLSDQDELLDNDKTPPYINAVQNYIGNCNLTDARNASPISLIDSGTAAWFKPMYFVQCDRDTVCPERQAKDLQRALLHVGVCPEEFDMVYLYDPSPTDHTYGNEDHALALWEAPYPNDDSGKTVGQKAIDFLHVHLD